jgi:hypothetical protein
MHCVLFNLSYRVLRTQCILSSANWIQYTPFRLVFRLKFYMHVLSIPSAIWLAKRTNYESQIKESWYKKCNYLYKHIQFSLGRKNASWVEERCIYPCRGYAHDSWHTNRIRSSQAESKTRQGTAKADLQLHSTRPDWCGVAEIYKNACAKQTNLCLHCLSEPDLIRIDSGIPTSVAEAARTLTESNQAWLTEMS